MADKLEQMVYDLKRRVTQLESKLQLLNTNSPRDEIGSKERPMTFTYMIDPELRSKSYRVSVDHNGGSPQHRFEEV